MCTVAVGHFEMYCKISCLFIKLTLLSCLQLITSKIIKTALWRFECWIIVSVICGRSPPSLVSHQSPGWHVATPVESGPAGWKKQQRGSDRSGRTGDAGKSSEKSLRPGSAQQGQQMWGLLAELDSAFVTASFLCRGGSSVYFSPLRPTTEISPWLDRTQKSPVLLCLRMVAETTYSGLKTAKWTCIRRFSCAGLIVFAKPAFIFKLPDIHFVSWLPYFSLTYSGQSAAQFHPPIRLQPQTHCDYR